MAELKRVLSYRVLLLIVINSIMGTGIFFLPAIGVMTAGPASLISWLILSFIAIYIAMCFAELTSMYPEAGGIYEFSKHAYGRFPSFLIGWLTIIASNITIGMLVLGAIRYLLPTHLKWPSIFISLLLIIAFNFVAYRGMRVSAFMLVTFTFITLIAIFSLIIPASFNLSFSNIQPFFPFGTGMVFLAIFLLAETFFGWESPVFLAGETKDGARVVPKAIIHGTIIIALICLVFVFTSIGSFGWQNLAQAETPLTSMARFHYGEKIVDIFSLLVYLAIIGSVADWIVSSPRLILSMAKDKLFLGQLSRIHPKYNTPSKAIIFQAIVSSVVVFIGAGSYFTLLNLLVPILIVMYCLVLFSVLILRHKKAKQKRYLRVPFAKFGITFVALVLLSLLFFWARHTANAPHILALGLSLVLIGIPLYLLLEMYHDPRTVGFAKNILAYLTLMTEEIALPKSVRREIVRLLGKVHGKTILEFGCGVGTLTLHLAEEVGQKGKIYATELSRNEINISQRRMNKRGHRHVKLIYDSESHSRIHPSIPKAHVAVSVGAVSYLKDEKQVLKHMNKRLKKGSKVCFVEYDKFFDLIPTVSWLEDDEKIKNIFLDAGFAVNVERKQGMAWKYIFIYGEKVRNL